MELRTSPTLHKEKKTSKRKVHLGGRECRRQLSVAPPLIPFRTKCLQHLFECSFLHASTKMCLCTHQQPLASPCLELWQKENSSGNHNRSRASTAHMSEGCNFRMGPHCTQHKCSAKPEFDCNCIWDVDTTDAIGCARHQSDDGNWGICGEGERCLGGYFSVVIIPPQIHCLAFYSYLFRVKSTPAQQYTLCSLILLSRVPLKCPTQYESETAEALLSLFSPRLGTLDQPDHDYTMNVNSQIQALTQSDVGVAAASLSPMPQENFLNSSGCAEYDSIEPDIDGN